MALTVDEMKANVAAFRRKEKERDLAAVKAALKDVVSAKARLTKRGMYNERDALDAVALALVGRRFQLFNELEAASEPLPLGE